MKEKILKLLSSSCESDIKLAIELASKYLDEPQFRELFSQVTIGTYMQIYFYKYSLKYRSNNGFIFRTLADPEDLLSLGYKQLILE